MIPLIEKICVMILLNTRIIHFHDKFFFKIASMNFSNLFFFLSTEKKIDKNILVEVIKKNL